MIGSIPNDLNQTIYTTQFKSLRLSYDFDSNQSDKGDLWFWLKSIFKRFWCLINNNNWKSWSVICRHLQGVYSTTVFSLCDVTDRWWIKFVLWWIAVACWGWDHCGDRVGIGIVVWMARVWGSLLWGRIGTNAAGTGWGQDQNLWCGGEGD